MLKRLLIFVSIPLLFASPSLWARDTVPTKCFKGTLTVWHTPTSEEQTRSFNFAVDPTVGDDMAGDSDLHDGAYRFMNIPAGFREQDRVCKRRVELNGTYIQTCSGLYLRFLDPIEQVDDIGQSGFVYPNMLETRNARIGSFDIYPADCPDSR